MCTMRYSWCSNALNFVQKNVDVLWCVCSNQPLQPGLQPPTRGTSWVDSSGESSLSHHSVITQSSLSHHLVLTLPSLGHKVTKLTSVEAWECSGGRCIHSSCPFYFICRFPGFTSSSWLQLWLLIMSMHALYAIRVMLYMHACILTWVLTWQLHVWLVHPHFPKATPGLLP